MERFRGGGGPREGTRWERISVADWPPTRGAVSPLALHIQHRYIRAENLENLREAKNQSDKLASSSLALPWRHILLCLGVLITERGMDWIIVDSHDNPVFYIFTRLH